MLVLQVALLEQAEDGGFAALVLELPGVVDECAPGIERLPFGNQVAAVLALAANAGHGFLIGQELARAAGKHHLRCVLLACEIDELAGDVAAARLARGDGRSEEHTSELQSLMRN